MARPHSPAARLLGTLALAAMIGLAGCTMGPDYVRPKLDLPTEYRFALAEAADTANTAWWQQFDDPVLDGLIREALANNQTVKIAAANVESAAAVLTQARSPLFPQVGYSGEAAREQVTREGATPVPQGVSNPSSAYQILLGASWEIDLWGRIRRQSESARANLLATQEARRGVLLSLVGSVGTLYVQLLGLDEQLRIARQTRDAYRASLKLFELQFEHGQVSEMAVAQAKSQLYTAEAQIPQIEQQIAQGENALSILLGRNPGPIVRGRTIGTLGRPGVPAGVPSQLLARRPDIAQSEQQLIAANAQIGAAKALYFPAISLTGNLGYASSDLSKLFGGSTHAWTFAGDVTGPIFTAGAVSGQVAQAQALQQAALGNYRQSIQKGFADVSDALIGYAKLGEQTAAQGQLVAALRDYARLARIQYDGGYVPFSTVLQAEQELFPAELGLAATQAAHYNALVRLYTALGGGWIDLADRDAPQPRRGPGPFAPKLPATPGAAGPAP
jgi:multidrug efflux system outer membrane protein